MRYRFQMLNEDIAAVRKMYPTLSNADFEYIVKRFDPTYRAGSDSVGKYGKWMLNLAKKGIIEVDGSEDQIEEFQYVLGQFEKKKAALDNKDIGQFKTFDELKAKMRNVAEPELTARQKERQMRKAYKDAELIWQNDEWQVWYPQNWDAACTLGKGTSWCTADSRTPRYYIYYAYDVPDSGNMFPIDKLYDNVYTHPRELLNFLAEAELLDYFPEFKEDYQEYGGAAINWRHSYKYYVDEVQQYIEDRYSKDCIVDWGESGVWFYNPHEKLPYKECESPLFVFINKKDPNDKWQLWCGNLSWTDDVYNTETWSFADKRDNLRDFEDVAWHDRSFADFAIQELGLTMQDIFITPPPWDDEYQDGQLFKWGLRYYNQDGVIKEEEIAGTKEYIEAYTDSLQDKGWIITLCKQLEEV